MNLRSIGHLVAERRRALGLTLTEFAVRAGVGRSTLAAFESGKLAELGLGRVARLCAAADLILEARPLLLEAPIMAHRHLNETAGRELTKAAISDVIIGGDIKAWRSLVQAMRADKSGGVARRVREWSTAAGSQDPKARAFTKLLPILVRAPRRRAAAQ